MKEEAQNSTSNREIDGDYETESDIEDFEDYKWDGYHPVILGETFNSGKYGVVQKLGWGNFSTVWLVKDKVNSSTAVDSRNHFAMKIQKSKPSYAEVALDELELLRAQENGKNKPEWQEAVDIYNQKFPGLNLTKEDNFCISLLDNFAHYGMHGKHYCIVFPIMGPNLLDIMRFFTDEKDHGIPIKLIKRITRQLLIGIDYMSRFGEIIHTDLKPENVMLELDLPSLNKFIGDVNAITTKPLSMKYLKKIQLSSQSKNANKNKKKKQAKKAKALQKAAENQASQNNPDDSNSVTQDESKSDTNTESVNSSNTPAFLDTTNNSKQEMSSVSDQFSCQFSDSQSDKPNLDKNLNTKNGHNNNGINTETDINNQSLSTNVDLINIDSNNPTIVMSKKNVETVLTYDSNCNQEDDNKMVQEDLSQVKKTIEELPAHTLGDSNVEFIPTVKDSVAETDNSNLEKSDIVEKPIGDSLAESNVEFVPNEKLTESETIIESKVEEESNSSDTDNKSSANGNSDDETKKNPADRYEDQSFTYMWKNKVKIDLNESINVKLVDFGNACWTYKHYTDSIQTREYRSPEVILGFEYKANTDIWSLACMIFELITGDYLFRPSNKKNKNVSPDEQHLAQMLATLGPMPKKFYRDGKYSRDFFNKSGKLQHTEIPEYYPISQILADEYDFSKKAAKEIEDFLMPMLNYNPQYRISAQEVLNSPWLNMDE